MGVYIDCPLLWTSISYVYKYELQKKKNKLATRT